VLEPASSYWTVKWGAMGFACSNSTDFDARERERQVRRIGNQRAITINAVETALDHSGWVVPALD